MKPAGLNSGAALREYQDVESLRFTTVSRQYEEMFMEAARQVVGIGKDIYAEDNRHEVVVSKDSNSIDVIDWGSVDMDEDSFVLKVHPTSSLPATPSGRLGMKPKTFWTSRILKRSYRLIAPLQRSLIAILN